MAKATINVGTNADDGTGDSLRAAFVKVNDNFTEVYDELGGTSLSRLRFVDNKIIGDVSNENVVIDPNGTGIVNIQSDASVTGDLRATGETRGATLQVDGVANIDGSAVIDGTLNVNAVANTTSITTATLIASGTATFNGNVDLGDSSADTVTITGRLDSSIVPDTDQTYDIGGTSLRFKDIFVQDVDAGADITAGGDRMRIVQSHTPASSIGVSGDTAGDFAFDGNYIYYATADYDGSANIWKRVAWSGDTW